MPKRGEHRGYSVYPRVGGGNIARIAFCAGIAGLSPRGRGKHNRRRRKGCE